MEVLMAALMDLKQVSLTAVWMGQMMGALLVALMVDLTVASTDALMVGQMVI